MENEKFQELVLQQLKALTEGQKFLTEKYQSLSEGQRQLAERLTKVENVVTRIENDHGTTLNALLDGYHHNSEVLADHTERLDRIESKITSHDIQISILDKTKSNKRKAK